GDINPEVWTRTLESYIDTVPDENEETFNNSPGQLLGVRDKLLRLYAKKFLLIFEFDWIESHAHTAKIMKSSTNSGSVREDIKGTKISGDFDIFHMEVVDARLTLYALSMLSDAVSSLLSLPLPLCLLTLMVEINTKSSLE
ncbi:17132_t:CDS:2, partial [Acaulospora morrowiae]